jgi:L-ribulose-5-phosphate 3-epimerase
MKTNTKKIPRRRFIKTVSAAGVAASLTGIYPANLKSEDKNGIKMPICLFSKHLQWLGYDELAEISAEIGFDGIDLTVRPGGHVHPENVTTNLPKAKKAADKAGITMPMMTTAITNSDHPLTEKILQTAQACGIQYYRMGYLKYEEGISIDTCLENYKPVMAKLAKMNETYRIHGAYQNHAGRNIGAPVWDLWLLLKDINPAWLGCQYDIRHATVEGGECWPLALKLLHAYIRCMVIKDFTWEHVDGKWRIMNVPVGEGMVDFKHYFQLMKELHISGPLSLHYEYPVLTEADRTLSPADKKKKTIAVLGKDVITLRKMLAEL